MPHAPNRIAVAQIKAQTTRKFLNVGGYADFSPAAPRAGNVNMKWRGDSGTLEFGGGVDTRPLIQFKGVPMLKNLPIGGRFELRDFYSGQPHYGVATQGDFQNNLAFTGGIVDSILGVFFRRQSRSRTRRLKSLPYLETMD